MSALSDAAVVHFSRGIPPLEAIPSEQLADHTAFVLEERRDEVFQYAPIGRHRGDPALRTQLGAFHGVDPERIFVGNGSLQVLDLVAALLLGAGGDVIVETPTYDRAVGIVERHGGRLVNVPLEPDGIDLERLRDVLRDRPAPAFLYTIPDFQNPSGVTTSAAKRRALAELAAEYGFPILEDVPYRELRYHGETPPLLGELAGDARVITLGSLSKVLSPGLRVGYAIVDPDTATALAALAEGTYLSPSPLCQAIAARCLASGTVGEHIEHVRDFLRPRHDAALAAVREHLGDALLAVPNGGYYLAAHLPVGVDEPTLLRAARDEGVVLTPGSAFYPGSASPPAGTLFVRLPFQALEPEEFASGIERLARLSSTLR
ncbi:MAG TPA: PLP-dependent aminotransferase family protein [Thermoleophilaceae bacterium]